MALNLQAAFSSLDDTRVERHKRHKLLDIITHAFFCKKFPVLPPRVQVLSRSWLQPIPKQSPMYLKRSISIAFKNPPTALDAVVFAVIRRIESRHDFKIIFISKFGLAFHKPGPMAGIVRPIIQVDNQLIDQAILVFIAQPPVVKIIDNKITVSNETQKSVVSKPDITSCQWFLRTAGLLLSRLCLQ